MKKILFLLLFLPLLVSCTSREKFNTYHYEVIDTTEVHEDNLGQIDGYSIIIMMDSSYYSARLDQYKRIFEIGRKLNNVTNIVKTK